MALVIKDRVKETTTTTGTGAISLGGAATNFVTFSSVLSDADTTYYAIVDTSNSAFEVGLGTYASSGNTITRTTVLASSNSGSAVNLQAGTKSIFCAFPADKAVYEESDGSVLIENLELNANAIKSTDTNGNIQLFPNGTGFTELYGNTNSGTIRFNCENNSHGVTVQGPAHSASATYTVKLPDTLGLTQASGIVTSDANGVVSFDNGTIDEVTTVTSSSNAATINLRDGNVFEHDLTENVTYTFSNPAASGRASAFVLKIIQDSSARTITWPTSVDWAAATAPTLTTTNNGVDVFVFLTIDGGTTYYGFTAGQAMG
tara:strand:+ start:429 stop:1379 length:951 start_codon:yes stop_codon:yes gene_type:complete